MNNKQAIELLRKNGIAASESPTGTIAVPPGTSVQECDSMLADSPGVRIVRDGQYIKLAYEGQATINIVNFGDIAIDLGGY